MAVNVKHLERPKRTFWEQTYLPEIAKGITVTFSHFVKALLRPKENVFTVSYPEEKRAYPSRYRGRHRLMLREDGQVRCVACMCCSTICPANCIHIVAAEHDDPNVEKYPQTFVIDHLRCIVCGLCVEACPCDAIRMDSGVHCAPFEDRALAFLDRDLLMREGALSAATQGGAYST